MMEREQDFRDFLEFNQSITSMNSLRARMSRARTAEDILGKTLDTIVTDDNRMYDALVYLRDNGDRYSSVQNAVRKYYLFVNGKEFPPLRHYRR